jgi:2-polyprenyl-3-methyl-5-hydroxy-6-metoxy-1,4-benzoquinol methylase
VRDDPGIRILECKNCGLVSLSGEGKPDKFYEQAGMHGAEPPSIEGMLRNSERDDERRFRFLSEQMTNRDVLDFGCGGGEFLLKARSRSRYVMGVELEKRLGEHFRANYLDVVQTIDELGAEQQFDLITAFHVIEHLQDPASTLTQLASRLRGGGGL